MFTVDIIEQFINNLPLSGNIICYELFQGNTIIRINNILHLRAKSKIFLDSNFYEVLEVDHLENTFTIEGDITPVSTYRIPAPFYFHGTPTATSNHISKLKNDDKIPLIYLPEILTEDEQSLLSSIQRITNLRLIFLDNAHYSDWSTDDHYTNRLTGLNKLVDLFIDTYQKDRKTFVGEGTTFTRTNHVKWGNFSSNRHTQSIFNEYLTGVEIQFTSNIKRGCQPENRDVLCSNKLTLPSQEYTLPSLEYTWQH